MHYENAERALTKEDWRRAVEELQQALERRGDSGLRVRSYGMNVVDYFPYLKLGIAYHHLGQQDAALEAFATEERLGVVEGSPAARSELADYRQRVVSAKTELAAAARRRANEAIDTALRQARALEGEGKFDEAMAALGRGLALSPEHPEANQLMTHLGERALEAERARRASATPTPQPGPSTRPAESAATLDAAVTPKSAASTQPAPTQPVPTQPAQSQPTGETSAAELTPDQVLALEALRQAEAHLAAGRYEDALAAANRVLAANRASGGGLSPASERGRTEALAIIRRAYEAISRRVLGAGVAENLPPAIRFADQRQELDGERVEVVDAAEFRLSGVVLDRSPVSITLLDELERPLESTVSTQALGELFVTEFRALRRLPAGPSRFIVVATDDQGASSRSEYQVRYRRPWFRSLWLGGVLAGVLLAAVAGTVAWRARRRRERRRRRFNPYVAGGPIFNEALFFGREALIQRVLQTVHNNSLLLYGERRIGKTSLLHQLVRRLEALDDPAITFYPVYVDLQGTPEGRLFATLADAIYEALGTALGPVLGGAGRERALAREGGYSHHDLVQELHGWLKTLAARSPKQVKLVLLVDEIDELNHYDPRVNQSLRSLFMKRFSQNLAAVVAGVGIRKQWELEGSPWYNFFEELAVEPIAEAEALRLVQEPSRGTFRFEPAAARRIVEQSGGRPFLIQRRCLALLQRLHEEGRTTVTLADLEAVPPPRGPAEKESAA